MLEALSAALATITAAVVGVILNLAVWFALHVLFGELREIHLAGATLDIPVLTSVNPAALGLSIIALLAVFRFKLGMLWVLGGCSLLGVIHGLASGAI